MGSWVRGGSPAPGGPAGISVSGGAGGTDARLEDLHTLARLSDELAVTLAEVAAEAHAVLVAPDVVASAVLDPVGVAAFERELLAALDGSAGLMSLAARYSMRALGLRAAVATYRGVDQAQQAAFEGICWSLGANPLAAVNLAFAAAPFAGIQIALDGGDAQHWLSDHLGLVDGAVDALPGMITTLTGGLLPVSDVPSGGHLIGLLYPQGTPTVAESPVPGTEASDTKNPLVHPPHTLSELFRGLDYRNVKVTGDGPDQIDVRMITHADGSKAYIVDIPGTKMWDLPGQDPGAHLNTLGTNIHLTGADLTAREQAIADALHQAGASSTDPVMLIGHSQGGIIAAQAAHDAANGGFVAGGHSYNITHVVTAGSPIGRIDIPPGVQVLALENQHDIVPHLDGATNPDRPNQTTVTFDSQQGDFGGNHDTATYAGNAQQILDGSTNPSIQGFRKSASTFLPVAGSGAVSDYTLYTIEGKAP
jgi:hypothetical protein